MSNRRSLFSMVAAIACLGLAFTASFGDDLTGKHHGGGGDGGQRGGGGNSGGGGSNNGGDHQRGGGGGSTGGGSNNGGDHQRGGGGGGNSSGGGSSNGGGNSGGGSNNGGDHQRGGGGSEGGRRGGGGDGGSRDRDRDRGSSSGGGGTSSGGSSGGTWPGRTGGSGGGNDTQRNGGATETRNGGTRIYIPNQGGGDDLLSKRGSSRSGNPQYGSNSNIRSRDRNSGPQSFGRAPTDLVRGSLGNQVRRSDVIRIGGTTIRFGYTHYDYRWRDDYFFYSHYVFDPFAYPSYCSPWYYYPQLPPYFLANRCVVLNGYVWSPFVGVNYVYYPAPNYNNNYNYNYNDRRRSDLDYSIDDIVNAFENDDRRAVSRLVPRNGRVNILIDGKYAYSMNADDFYDTLVDATENSKTSDYKILDVQTNRDGAAIWARHDFEDPWGRRQSVYHYFHLEQEGRDWVIREFGTSENRW